MGDNKVDKSLKMVALTAAPSIASVLGGLSVSVFNRECYTWWETVKKPSWAPKNMLVFAAADFATMIPLGYASYLVLEHGAESADVKKALVAYGATQLVALSIVPAVTTKDVNAMFKSATATAICGAVTAYLFSRVDHDASLLALPYVAWCAFYGFYTNSLSAQK